MPITSSRYVKLPFSHSTLKQGRKHIGAKGTGMGSVLLRTAGGGAGSSYMDMDDYIATTGINPYARAGTVASGSGLKKITEKLSKLGSSDKAPKRKNIVMSM
jgi:hypothetical protein